LQRFQHRSADVLRDERVDLAPALECLGVALHGARRAIGRLTGNLRLLR